MEKLKIVQPSGPSPENTKASEKSLKPAREKLIKFIADENYYDLPQRFRTKTIDIFKPQNVADHCRKLVLDGQSVFLTGKTGTGKTLLACSLIIEYGIAKYDPNYHEFPRAKFVPLVRFLEEIKETFSTGQPEGDIVDKYANAPFLAIDDLGVEKVTDWSRQILYTLIDRRYSNMKQTIITSNLSLEKIAETIDDRIASRIVEMGPVITLEGDDHRLKG